MLGAVIISVLLFWEARTQPPPEQSVRVYRTHGCKCVFPWIRDLQLHGFAVQAAEPESLRPIRAALHTPKELRGCHIGVFMGYFVEGHVPATVLRRLTTERPDGRGIALRSESTGAARVLLFDDAGNSVVWHRGSELVPNEHGEIQEGSEPKGEK